MKHVITNLGIGCVCVLLAVIASLIVKPRYGIFYDIRHQEAVQYRVTDDRVEIYVHGEWVEHMAYPLRHLEFHIDAEDKFLR